MIFLYVYEEEKLLGLLGFRIRENLEDVTRYGEISIISVDSTHTTERRWASINGLCRAISKEA